MSKDSYGFFIKTIVLIVFLLMIGVNAAANLIPLNGLTTGQVSDSYPNLFTPMPFTFAIWSLIYFLLFCYVLYQMGFFQKAGKKADSSLLKSVAVYFIVSSLANAAWIVSWHYRQIPLSFLLMAVILVSLILVNHKFDGVKIKGKEIFFLKLPFRIYFGWITVATIANAVVLLVSLNWNGWGLPEEVWLLIILAAGMIIGVATMLKQRDFSYGLVLIWAYFGILVRHVAATGYDGAYPKAIVMLVVCLSLFAATEAYLILSRKRRSCRT